MTLRKRKRASSPKTDTYGTTKKLLKSNKAHHEACEDDLPRCFWANEKEANREYHDNHWGNPIKDSQTLFQMLSLCSQQAGVSWRIIWNKRAHYKVAFKNWDMKAVAELCERDIDDMIAKAKPGEIMRNKGKLNAIVHNAKLCLKIENEVQGGLSGFLWSFTGGQPKVCNAVIKPNSPLPNESSISKAMAGALKARGFKYLGSITLQAFAQQVGIINAHCLTCFKNPRSFLRSE